MDKYCWDVGWYAMGCRVAIGLVCWHQCVLVLCDIILDYWLPWDWSWSGKCHNTFIGSQQPSTILSLFFLLWLCVCQMWLFMHCHTIVQLKCDCRVKWEIFLQFLPVLINCELEFELAEWMPSWMNCGVSLWLDVLMSPGYWLWLSGYPGIILCIPSQQLDHLHVVLVGI